MKKLRTRFERFCYKNRNKGIPNLMLYITLANAIVYIFGQFSDSSILYDALCFDRGLILQGQVWRLFTCICTSVFGYGNILFVVIGLFCYFSLGRAVENAWGTFKFNLFYLTGLLMMDVFAMIFADTTRLIGDTICYMPASFYADMGSYLNLSLFIAYATLYPNAHFLLLFIIPVKAWIFALFYLGITIYEVWALSVPDFFFPHNLFPLIALANYFLFFGKDVANVIPQSWRANIRRLFRKKGKGKTKAEPKTGTIPFPKAGSYEATTARPKADYTHCCTVCGRTNVSHPDLEFRYCSRCSGYRCYCEDHINNHTHIE